MAANPTRRNFLKGAATLAVAQSMSGVASALEGSSSGGRVFAYLGTYTADGDLGPTKNGEGIYRYDANLHTGELTNRTLVAKTTSPSWITLHPSKRYLYAINEVENYEGNNGSVSAFEVDRGSGKLRALNVVSSAGAGPAHMSVDPSGKFAFVANYMGGSIAVFPIRADGSLGSAVYTHRDTGHVGSTHPTDAPPGSFVNSGHHRPHAHMIHADPYDRFVISTDLGQDRIYSRRLDHATGKLTTNPDQPFVQLPTGDGPRHFVFHPNKRWFYSLQEEASTVTFFHYDAARGMLHAEQKIPSLSPDYAGTSMASEIAIAPSGRFLYAANRLHNTIAVFRIAADGRLAFAGESSTMGDTPRNFRIDPTGRFLFACNQLSDNITSFRIDQNDGLLHFTGRYIAGPSPVCLIFLD